MLHLLFQTDQAIVHIPKTHLTKYDKLFKQFKHSQALDAAFEVRLKMLTCKIQSAFIGIYQNNGLFSGLSLYLENGSSVIVLLVVLHTQGTSNINEIRLRKKIGRCDLDDLKMAAISGFLDRKTFILVEIISTWKNAVQC